MPLYNETISTEPNANTDNVVFGNKFARFNVTPGIRSHSGDIEIMAEPNTSSLFWKSLLTEGAITGSDPATHPLTASFTKPASLTLDVSLGNQVARIIGFQASEIAPSWNDNECRWKIKGSALKTFLGAEIASISTATVTLKTPVNQPTPATGIVIGDLVTIIKASDGSRQNLTVQTVTTTTVTFTTTPTGVTSGDVLVLRPATPSFALLEPFLWSRTEFRFADTAANALTATHTPLEDGTEFVVSHPFEDDAGAKSSGSFDPSRLVRSQSVDVTFKAKKYFENPLTELRPFQALTSQACVIRMFSGASYEFRLTLNKLYITKGGDKAKITVDEALFYEPEYTPSYHAADGQGFDVKILNAISS
ncbi:hypothetical protein [Mycolicibacterium sp. PDY-3]|uniref:hypothetical protein n=1 Tax=Mycolicibacterium sp. PDY-3 TaxID=3376069 RepID=UPI0037A77A4A